MRCRCGLVLLTLGVIGLGAGCSDEADEVPTAIIVPSSTDAEVGQSVTLDGRRSTPSGGGLLYIWRVEQVPVESAIDDASGYNPDEPWFFSFVPDAVGSYVISLRVEIGDAISDPASATINVSECAEGATRCEENNVETCNVQGFWEATETCRLDQVCEVVDGDAICVAGSGGTGGSGGAAGTGGSAGTGGTAGSGGTGGSGGAAGTGGTGGSASSCAELDIVGLPQLSGVLSLSDDSAAPDESIRVTADVDPDTEELTATILNESSGFPGGSCSVLTSGNETVECDLRVETVADPGPHVLELQLRADSSNRLDYVLYTPGDGDTYVRIEFENDLPGAETATTCLQRNVTIQF